MLNKQVIWLNGMPRSGTTWMSQIFASSSDVRLKFCPLFSYEFKNMLNENSSVEEWQWLFEQTFTTKSEYLDQEYLRKNGLVPKFHKAEDPSHLVIKSTRHHQLTRRLLELNSNVKVIHMIRDPRASIASWLTNPYEFPSAEDPMKQWRSGECRKDGVGEYWGFDDWVQVSREALALAEQFPTRFKIVSYEEVISHPISEIKDLFKFCNLSFSQTTAEFIASSQSKHDDNKRSVFKKPEQVIHWSHLLDKDIVNSIHAEIVGTELEGFLDKTRTAELECVKKK
ncbi:sulfotransferase family protein [Motilimonas eburnea]|uniref:sulfotransferase family protein n=1 Tax=Motilimonas eburnea TaxID=1737488 RepID=UPI001E3246E2|nr:sulfotransferase [Motilimonas eburnea]MCE2571529.1 sulfotransferase [Motilimonas eburnea]